jgi:hypothetical protein
MVGSAGIATRVGGAAVTTKLAPQETVSTDQKNALTNKKVAATTLPANLTKGTPARGSLVRSGDGRLQAIALPGAAWCGEVVGIRFESKPGLLDRDPASVQKFMAGVRVAVGAECPNAIGIRFIARGGRCDRRRVRGLFLVGTQHFPGPRVDQVRPRTGRADHRLIRICVIIGRIVSNPSFNNQARIGASECKCRHAANYACSSDGRP